MDMILYVILFAFAVAVFFFFGYAVGSKEAVCELRRILEEYTTYNEETDTDNNEWRD